MTAISGAVCVTGCSLLEQPEEATEPQPRFTLAFQITQDTGAGVERAQIIRNQKSVGTTGKDGKATVTLEGEEGDRVELVVKCPEPYDSPKESITTGLRHLAPGSPPPQFRAQCERLSHTIVVGIRAEKGPNLPVMRLGQVIARTDFWGVAHVMIDSPPNQQVTLKLDTSDNDRLRPQNPTLTFMASARDELVLLEQKFRELPKKKKRKPRVKRPTPL